MAWEVEVTSQFEAWWNSLSNDEQVEISAKVELLQEFGPTLPRPHADVISTSRHANMKELRGKVHERHLRVLYAFDPRWTALLLLGGDKTGDPKWLRESGPGCRRFVRPPSEGDWQATTEVITVLQTENRSNGVLKNFNTLREKMSPAARERSRRLAAKYRSGMALDELRQARDMTQVHLARILGVNQAAVSKLERRADMYVSTLQDFVRAMGGELKITAKFPEGTVEISQFEDMRKSAGED